MKDHFVWGFCVGARGAQPPCSAALGPGSIMDEEFGANASELVFKKSYADIMTTQEFWQWVSGMLTQGGPGGLPGPLALVIS